MELPKHTLSIAAQLRDGQMAIFDAQCFQEALFFLESRDMIQRQPSPGATRWSLNSENFSKLLQDNQIYKAYANICGVDLEEPVKPPAKPHPLVGLTIVEVRSVDIKGTEGCERETSVEIQLSNGSILIPMTDESCDEIGVIMQTCEDGDGIVFKDRIV